jgi:hypothetical protein
VHRREVVDHAQGRRAAKSKGSVPRSRSVWRSASTTSSTTPLAASVPSGSRRRVRCSTSRSSRNSCLASTNRCRSAAHSGKAASRRAWYWHSWCGTPGNSSRHVGHRQPDGLLRVAHHPQDRDLGVADWPQEPRQPLRGGLLQVGRAEDGTAQHLPHDPQLVVALLRLQPVEGDDDPPVRRDRGGDARADVLLAGAQQGQVDLQQVLHVSVRERHRRVVTQLPPDLLSGTVLREPQVADADHHVQSVPRPLHLPRLRLCRAVHRPPVGARRLTTTESKVRHVLDAGQRLNRLAPHRMAVGQRPTTVRAGGQLRPVPHPRHVSPVPGSFHWRLPAPARHAWRRRRQQAPMVPLSPLPMPLLPRLKKTRPANLTGGAGLRVR